MTEEKKNLPLNQVMDENNFKLLISEVLKTQEALSDGRSFMYKEVKFPYGGKVYYVLGRHISLDDIYKNGQSNCKICNGKGYYFANLSKKQYPDPKNFLLEQDALPKDLSPEEQAKWQNEENAKATWRVLNMCNCAIRTSYKKDPRLLANDYKNVWLVLDYEVKDE
jgi:hypothetical protein